jgi:ABC-type bacteriocin/lantibiotic exporter with double-glycine peptidase domain
LLDTFQKLRALLSLREQRQALLLLAMMLVLGVVEMAGIASIFPLIAVMSDPSLVESNPWLKLVYDRLGFTSLNAFFIFLSAIVFVVIVLRTLFTAVTSYGLLRYSQTRIHVLSVRLLSAYLHRPYAWFLDRHTADLSKSVLSEVEQVVNGCLKPSLQLVSQGIVAVMIVGLVVAVDPTVAMTALLSIGVAYGVVYAAIRNYLRKKGKERMIANRARFKIAQEVLGGVKEVKVGGLERGYLRRFGDASRQFAHVRTELNLARELPRHLLELIAIGGVLVVIVVLIIRSSGSLNSAMPVVALYAFAGLRLLPAIQTIYQSIVTLRFEAPALEALHGELMQDEKVPASKNGPRIHLTREITLDHLTFQYPNAERTALQDISLVIPAGSKVGFVGTTGAGKSTIVDVVLGLLEPQSGNLRVDGTDITAQNAGGWQRSVGYVPQHIFLTDESVAANIALGQRDDAIDMAAVERAARLARLHDFIVSELPNGYQTMVGDRGVRLSGGQRQRIGIARALYHDPEVLLLDEATSALDNATEEAVMSAVNTIGGEKTIVMIAHRLNTLKECDIIYEMADGRIVSKGSYEEVLARHMNVSGAVT